MATTRGLSAVDGVLSSTELTGTDLLPDTVVMVRDLETIQFYAISITDAGTGILLDNTLFANPLSKNQAVIPQIINGTLIAGGKINQIRDSGAFLLPLANSVEPNVILVVELPDTYAAQTPTITRLGADLISDNSGTDTSITFAGAAKLTLTSDGVSTWSL